MPELTHNSGQHLLPLDVPDWLARAVAPWRVEAAALWRSGIMLDLHSDRARIPVLVESPTAGPLAMSLLDPRIPAKSGAAFVRALHGQLQRVAPLRDWLQRARSLGETLEARSPVDAAPELAALVEVWRAWPEREADPGRQVAALPELGASATLPRAARAALTLHRFARGELLEGLASWAALSDASAEPSFTELHVDAIALGVLGRRDAATAVLGRAEALANHADAWLAIARAYEALEQRERSVAAHERVLALRGGEWDRLRLARARGELDLEHAVPRPQADAEATQRISFVRELIKILDAAGRYDEMLTAIGESLDVLGDAAPIDLVVRAAELHLWRGEGAAARARLAAVPDAAADPRAQIVLAAFEVLEGQPAEALARLDALAADGPTRLDRWAWQAEANLALGRPAEALECIDQHIVLENSLVAYLIKLLALVRLDPQDTLARTFESRTFLDALIADVLPSLRPAAQIAEARTDPDRFAALIRGILDDMGGNRGPKPTWCRRDEAGARRLERVRVRPSGRDAAVANLIRIRTTAPEQVLAGFDAVLAEYPNSPHPYTYRGELLIWLGRYQDALASFDAADARAPTRWSYVGRAAAYDLIGESELADHWTSLGIVQFGELETATTHVYRGERLRKLEDWAAARRDLETALEFKTRRLGARINLALVYLARGETELWDQQIARLRADAPAFMWEAGDRGEPVDAAMLHAVLELMVGNRSSFLHTMIDRHGEFRVVPEPGRWIAHARLSLAAARDELGRVIAAQWQAR